MMTDLTLDDFIFILPAVTYSTILFITGLLYCLQYLLHWWKYRRTCGEGPLLAKLGLQNLPKIATIASFIVLERLIDRYANGFNLGLELTMLKVVPLSKGAHRRLPCPLCISFVRLLARVGSQTIHSLLLDWYLHCWRCFLPPLCLQRHSLLDF